MSMKIKCSCLFGLTSGIPARKTPANLTPDQLLDWNNRRRLQSNLDTVLQVISIRSQPENISDPVQITLDSFEQFGAAYQHLESLAVWQFEFESQSQSVFANQDGEFGALDLDCDSVPMFRGAETILDLPDCLDTSPELRNIYFEKIAEH